MIYILIYIKLKIKERILLLRKYQFAFGGSAIDPNCSSGFIMPLSGHIKDVKVSFRDIYRKDIENTSKVFFFLIL